MQHACIVVYINTKNVPCQNCHKESVCIKKETLAFPIKFKQRCSLIITGQANFGNVKILKVPVPPVFPLLRIGSVTGVLQIFPYVQKCAKTGGGCAKAGCVQNQEVSVQKQEVAEQKLPRPNHL